MTWNEALEPYRTGQPKLFDAAFLGRWGDQAWQPVDDDRLAAAKLHTQIVSRIATQRLGYLEGDEKSALVSVYALFQKAREIADAHPRCRHFETLAWYVLNAHVRRFTAKWHRQSERGALTALDATDDFRAEIQALRPILQRFDHLLLYLRDGVAAPWPAADSATRDDAIATEMQQDVVWGIRPHFSGFRGDRLADAEAINRAEREAVGRRRVHYKLADSKHATGLAISGGGIRSATFSLGVLVSLAERGLLPQFDYLSTVSGGGYLGSFLSVFLQSPAPHVGLGHSELPFRREEGEAAALRHIRHHSKYLAVGSAWERTKMLSAQLYGTALNGLAVLWIAVLAAAAESSIRTAGIVNGADLLAPLLWTLLGGAVVSLVALRLGGTLARYADGFVAVPVVVLVAVLCWEGVERLHVWYATPSLATWSSWYDKDLWIAAAGAVSVVAPALATMLPRLLKRFGVAIAALTSVAAPLFLLGLYLVLYRNSHWFTTADELFGIAVPRAVLIAVLGVVVYVVAFDINSTSPHRHYRRKLVEAYLIQPEGTSASRFARGVSMKLSALGERTHKAPYHLINCALNVPSSRDAAMQGRLTDFFLFSAAYTGSPLIGYRPTSDWERLDRRLDIGTAMAISAAAAAPQMGLGTVKRFRFWLALLNVRLGYWARRPDVAAPTLGAPGILHLLREMLGSMDEKGAWVNLSDGGHIDNLGIYELLRRRCKYIVAVDGEQDPRMTFQGLTTLQRLAKIDLGVSIDVDLDDLRLKETGLSRSHFRLCRLNYPASESGAGHETGYLLYVKLSLTGNEGEFIRRYRLDEPVFPHHSTADQFFSEAQFEAYRSLGEHVGSKLFLRALVGDLADSKDVALEAWFAELGKNLFEPLTTRPDEGAARWVRV